MKKFIYTFVILILLLICPCCAYAFELTMTPSEVESAETFNLNLNMNEKIYLTNGHLKFDSTLFTFVSCDTAGVEIEKINDNEIAWFYTELQDSPPGINDIKFKFKAASVIKDTIENFEIEDGIYINTNEKVYENLDFLHPVKIKAKEVVLLPSTGGIGIWIFIISGLGIMIIVIIKRSK